MYKIYWKFNFYETDWVNLSHTCEDSASAILAASDFYRLSAGVTVIVCTE